MTPGAKQFANFSASSGGTGFSGFRVMCGSRRYDAVAKRGDFGHPRGIGRYTFRGRTDGAELSMILPDALHSVQLHVDRLARTQLREDNVRVRRPWTLGAVGEELLLVAGRRPDEVARQNLVVIVELVCRQVVALRSSSLTCTCNLELEDHGIAVGCLFARFCLTNESQIGEDQLSTRPAFMSIKAGSMFRGMRPIRWERTSSTTTLVLFHT
jgi:hypothetical protein